MLHTIFIREYIKKGCLPLIIMCIILSATNTLVFAKALLIGKVLDSEKGTPLENARVRIVKSGFKGKTDKNGQFNLPYVPGNFTFAVEREGYVPKGIPLSLSAGAKFPMEDIALDRFPALVDMYLNPVAGVEIKVKQQDYSGKGALLSTAKTNARGQFLMEYAHGELEVSVGKPGYRNMTMVVNLDRMPKIEKALWVLPPENPGLYHQNRLLGSSQFTFQKKPMQGLMIPAYYDGTYSVTGEPEIVEGKVPQVFYFVPKHGRTFGENMFASKGGTFIFRVGDDGVFAIYDDGVSRGEKIPYVKIEQVVDDVQGTFGGLVQQKLQILRIEGNLPEGAYVLFQGGGNSMDREPHPDESLGCWHFKVRGIVEKP